MTIRDTADLLETNSGALVEDVLAYDETPEDDFSDIYADAGEVVEGDLG